MDLGGSVFFVCKRKRVRIAEFYAPSADRQYSASAVHVAMQILREGDEIRKGRSLRPQDALQDLASTNQHPARLTCADLIFAIRSIRKVGLLLPQVGDHEVPSPAGFLASLSVQNVNQDSMYHRQATWTGNQLVISSRFIRALSKRTGWVCYNCCDMCSISVTARRKPPSALRWVSVAFKSSWKSQDSKVIVERK